ncbi:DEAD/DEAH box helicase, partial [Patescibacteria group bacterium]
KDMEDIKPMDRLLVGDVGFGKTEVALRAAVKAVEGGKQVAILAPTTILAEQHTKTFIKRLKGANIKVATLSRFQSSQEQKKSIAGIKSGKVDLVIGTHRLLSSDVSFKNLGLIIIDEEQRFGVRAKERLKHLRVNVDVLSMTATPIPRTLNLALAQVRDISTIETPPPGRLPIETVVAREDEEEMRNAILRELKRKGQVYLLHNHVATIEAMRRKIEKLVPSARVGVAHGQLSEDKLSKAMQDFAGHKMDVLVASTIIENGLDIPRVNTLIVRRSTHFGLSQLYQLRGRIGRGDRRAYAYFFYNNQELKGRARDRLTALLEATQLGGGFQVAMRDLEIRGAGNILGVEQSGTIQAVGLNLFLRLLRQAVSEIKGGIAGPRLDVKVELPLESYLPEEYISIEEDRLLGYQRLADTRSLAELEDEVDDLIHVYGEMPAQGKNYISLLRIRLLAELALVIKIETRMMRARGGKEQKRVVLEGATEFPADLIEEIMTKNPDWKLKGRALNIPLDLSDPSWINELERVLQILSKPQRDALKQNGHKMKKS